MFTVFSSGGGEPRKKSFNFDRYAEWAYCWFSFPNGRCFGKERLLRGNFHETVASALRELDILLWFGVIDADERALMLLCLRWVDLPVSEQ